MGKKALITGITGQDGSYLAELLISKGYDVHGIVRRIALEDQDIHFWRINHILDKITIHGASLENYSSIFKVIQKVQPDECYHLAAQSFVQYSFEDEFSTIDINLNGTHYILSSIKEVVPHCKVYFAATSEMFGKVQEVPQTEKTPFYPRSSYGIAKTAGFHLVRNYREAYNIFACSGILFNHESPRRGLEFVTRKVTRAVANIKYGMIKKLYMGNLDAKRDWGYAGDYVKAMWLMLQQEKPDDFVIATNKTYSIKDLLNEAFSYVDLNWQDYVEIDNEFIRPSEVNLLIGNPEKAKKVLGWKPEVDFSNLIKMMIQNDLEIVCKQVRN